ncbi:hypothetical protein B0H14DRAFT_3490726 [Mycena olivaceomarginata]|nr:hypothetical protein B0H14DRAFT_3490726 [Mycena olivaceomarginata]
MLLPEHHYQHLREFREVVNSISGRYWNAHNLPDREVKDRNKPEPTNLDKLGIEIDLKPVVKAQRAAVGIANHARIALKLRLLTDWRFLLDSQAVPSTDARNALLRNISLAPKWAPSLLSTHDRHTNIATAISRLIYHAEDDFPTFRFPSALENHPAPDSAEATDILRSFYQRSPTLCNREGFCDHETGFYTSKYRHH